MENRLAEVVDKTVIVEVDTELSLCSCESDVVDETCSLGGDDTCRVCRVDVTGGEVGLCKPLDFKVFVEYKALFDDVNNPVKCCKIKASGTYQCVRSS